MFAVAFATTALAAVSPVPGIPNFHEVNENIFRGAQPADEAWPHLAKLGVKVVIDLRRDGEGDHSVAAEAKAVEAAGMRFVHVPMNGLVAPTEEQVAKVLTLFHSGEKVFVHCKKGKDRTGTVIACYRILHDKWENKKALAEANSLGMHWIEVGMKNYIRSFGSGSVAMSPIPATITAP
jgi:tyrosine-protein phosphatase SIW14